MVSQYPEFGRIFSLEAWKEALMTASDHQANSHTAMDLVFRTNVPVHPKAVVAS
jgi:hypothetical protein